MKYIFFLLSILIMLSACQTNSTSQKFIKNTLLISVNPDSITPNSTQPDRTELNSTQPDPTEPDSTEPDSMEPDSTEPDSTKPDATSANYIDLTQINDNEIQSSYVQKLFDEFSQEQKIGQLLILRVHLDRPSNSEYGVKRVLGNISQVQPGGIILFNSANISIERVQNTILEFQKTSQTALFVSSDIEGGKVNRLRKSDNELLSNIPYAHEISNVLSVEEVRMLAEQIGLELYQIGINMNFAPVVDVLYPDTAAFLKPRILGNDVQETTEYSVSYMRGLQDAQVISVFKHFPGHGNTSLDSHKQIANIPQTYSQLLLADIAPYREAISNNLQTIMVGHLRVDSIDKDTIASASPAVVDLLRNTLAFDGVIITDSLQMKAISNNFEKNEFELAAIDAGINVLLDPKKPENVFNALLEKYNQDIIFAAKVDASVKKILMLKVQMGIIK